MEHTAPERLYIHSSKALIEYVRVTLNQREASLNNNTVKDNPRNFTKMFEN